MTDELSGQVAPGDFTKPPTAGDRGGRHTRRRVALVDLDGTVADVAHRLHFISGRRRDWEGFFAAAPQDQLLAQGAAEVTRLRADGATVTFLSGRPERCRADTITWLARHGLLDPGGPTAVLLRPNNDRRPAKVTKLEHIRRLRAEGTDIVLLIDDDEAVLAAAQAAGIPVLAATWSRPQDQAANSALTTAQDTDGRS